VLEVKAQAAVSRLTDPYRAGLALGEELNPVQPEVIFLFSSIHVGRSAELLQGLHDALDNESVVVVGGTGDGVFFGNQALHVGASALALNSEGRVRWHLIVVDGVIDQPAVAMREALAQAEQWLAGRHSPLMFMVADFRADASELEKVIGAETQTPIIGGMAGDDNRMLDCALFANQQVTNGKLLLLVVEGDLHFSLTLGQQVATLGEIGRVDAVEGRRLLRVDGISAQEFVARQYGRKVGGSDATTLALLDAESSEVRRLRSVIPRFEEDGGLELYGAVSVGDRVQLCLTRPDELIAEDHAIAKRLAKSRPLAALLVSCAGRKMTLGGALSEEVVSLAETFPGLPLTGFPSFGEIAPLPQSQGAFSRNLFHNMTYVLLLVTS
jgi:hypothetical protein